MDRILQMICRSHVVVKYMAHHKKEERFFPIIFISLWLTIVSQSVFYLIYTRLPNYDGHFAFGDQKSKIIIGIMFFVIIAFLSWVTNNPTRYNQAEKWFNSKSSNNKSFVIIVSACVIWSVFFAVLIWMLIEM